MGAVDLHVAIRSEHQQAGIADISGKMHEKLERAAVGLVQILEHEHDRLARRDSS